MSKSIISFKGRINLRQRIWKIEISLKQIIIITEQIGETRLLPIRGYDQSKILWKFVIA